MCSCILIHMYLFWIMESYYTFMGLSSVPIVIYIMSFKRPLNLIRKNFFNFDIYQIDFKEHSSVKFSK